jgi:hypothetical protein
MARSEQTNEGDERQYRDRWSAYALALSATGILTKLRRETIEAEALARQRQSPWLTPPAAVTRARGSGGLAPG